MDQKTGAEIIARVLKGERQAYALLVEEYKGPIFNLAYRMTGSREDADDLTQETFIRAYQNLHQFDQSKKFFTWLYTIGINLIRNNLKKNARDVSHLAAADSALEYQSQGNGRGEGDVLFDDRMIRLERIIQKLPVDLREAIILKFHQDLTFEEVANVTGDSVSAVKMRIYRGLEKMKQMMEDTN
ncbi:MAG: RNA polymerase [Deltaproteobacteria bacterium HGW-Deltaproteobacteria-12]|nr:MAG: RNA polymerase [Deltaproteobacteria bacterium HGW-Deltaproteobacteria-12]